METRTEKVKRFFDLPEVYLWKDFNVTIRQRVVRELLGNLKQSRILDIGCGDGRISLQYASSTNTIVLLDLSAEMLNLARQNTPAEFRTTIQYTNGDLQTYQSQEQFDVILCLGVLAHVDSVEHTIAKIASLLKPGGSCVVQMTDNGSLGGRLLNTAYNVRNRITVAHEYTLNMTYFTHLATFAHNNGMNIVKERRYLAPFPGMGRLPNDWLLKYQLYTLRRPALSKIGSEVICLLRKKGTA